MNKNDMDQPEIDRHRMHAGMPWVIFIYLLVPVLVALTLAWLIHRPHHPPNCPHPEQATQSTFPIDCR